MGTTAPLGEASVSEQSQRTRTIRVVIAQSSPIYHDKIKSLAKALDLIRDAAKRGAELIVFGETWFPGYPVWLDVCPGAALWNHEPTKEVFAELRETVC
jgi:predicted amidohydrolase